MRKHQAALAAIVTLSLFGGGVSEAAVNIGSVDGTSISSTFANMNFSSLPGEFIGGGNWDAVYNVSGITVPVGEVLTSVTQILELYPGASTTPPSTVGFTIGIANTVESVNIPTLTWNLAPSFVVAATATVTTDNLSTLVPGGLRFLITYTGADAANFLDGTAVTRIGNVSSSGVELYNGGVTYTTQAVPEPGAALLGSIGILGLLRRRRA